MMWLKQLISVWISTLDIINLAFALLCYLAAYDIHPRICALIACLIHIALLCQG
ncbi:hypothetical protein [Planktotalea sp.]|uniref:hypothetical protein n=1 Tax=Planktotalea sp. TaxID=2029877 RepID=UPI003D6B450E